MSSGMWLGNKILFKSVQTLTTSVTNPLPKGKAAELVEKFVGYFLRWIISRINFMGLISLDQSIIACTSSVGLHPGP